VEENMTKSGVFCTNCKTAYPQDGVPYRCPNCGGLYDYVGAFPFDMAEVDRSQPGMWCYRGTFQLPPDLKPVSLGEGNTPLIWAKSFNKRIALKCEFTNPSGSFKDRGSAVIAALLKAHGVTEAVEDSSGNAGASFAAYAARAGIKVRIFVPALASGPKRRQIEAYGAELVPILGSRSDVFEATKRIAESGTAYASHAYLPFNLPGYATIAYEIVEQLGEMPGAIVVPVGQGGLLLGLARGFDALRVDNQLREKPRMIGIQALACAPLWVSYTARSKKPVPVEENLTIAEGVRVLNPLRKEAVIAAVVDSGGSMYVVEENEILPARDALGRLGFFVEPTSAIVWAALAKMIETLPDPIVVILTGSGLKYG
jgi:threonine synthase